MTQFEHQILREPHEIAAIVGEWGCSVETEHGSLYATPEWVTSLWESHLEFRGVEFHVLRVGGVLRGIVPITRGTLRKFYLPFRTCGLLTNYYGRNHNDLILFGDRGEVFLAFLERLRHDSWDMFLLGSILDGEETDRMAAALTDPGSYRLVREPYVVSPYMTLRGDWPTYLAGRSATFRSELNLKRNRARRANMEIRRFTQPSDIEEFLSAMYSIEKKSWKESEGTSIPAQAHARRFYDVFLPKAASRGWLYSTLLYLDGQPAAFDMGVVHGGKFYALKASFDQNWKRVSPGTLIRADVLEQLWGMGLREHDFLGDPEPFKLRWTDEMRHHSNLYLYNARRPIPALYAWARQRRRAPRPATLNSRAAESADTPPTNPRPD